MKWFLLGGQERNVHGMKLVEGQGNEYQGGQPLEDDRFNTVYVLVCCLPLLPFHGCNLAMSIYLAADGHLCCLRCMRWAGIHAKV